MRQNQLMIDIKNNANTREKGKSTGVVHRAASDIQVPQQCVHLHEITPSITEKDKSTYEKERHINTPLNLKASLPGRSKPIATLHERIKSNVMSATNQQR